MRMDSTITPYYNHVYMDDSGTVYYIHVCREVLRIRVSTQRGYFFQLPFKNCCQPALIRHNGLLILIYLEQTADSYYSFRFLFPLTNLIHFSPALNYPAKPSYSVYSLENELFLSIMCRRKYSVCHLKFNPCSHSYSLRRLPFYKGI